MNSAYFGFRPFPQDVFPGLLGALDKCLREAGIPGEMIAPQLIAIASLLTQGIADVAWPNGIKAPVGANVYFVANSGTGKSLIRKILMEPIEQQLEIHNLVLEPQDRIDLIVEDITPESLLEHLASSPVVAIHSDEAGKLFRLKSAAPALISIIDGVSISKKRVSTKEIRLSGQRACIFFMEQPEIFAASRALMKIGKGGVGLINRCLASSFDGQLPAQSYHYAKLSPELVNVYSEKVHNLLGSTIRQIRSQSTARPIIKLSEQASRFFINSEMKVRQNSALGSPWFRISEYATRHTGRSLPLAAALHAFEHGVGGEISIDTMMRANEIGLWHIEAFSQMTFEAPKPSKVDLDSIQLERAILNFSHVTNAIRFEYTVLRTHSLNFGVSSARFNNALADLCNKGKIRVFTQERKRFVELMIYPYHQGI